MEKRIKNPLKFNWWNKSKIAAASFADYNFLCMIFKNLFLAGQSISGIVVLIQDHLQGQKINFKGKIQNMIFNK